VSAVATRTVDQLEIRSKEHGVEVVGVSFPDRTIELVVMPYEHPAMIHEPGRSYEEVVSRGAFAGVETRAGRIRCNRDHDVTRTVGRVTALHPSRDDGLVAELRISKTTLGEETLTLADDGVLDASAGFSLLRDADGKVVAGAEVWETRQRRRLNRLWLGHVALTPEPAYETAQVLAVRSQGVSELHRHGPESTPNKDSVRMQELRRQHDAINRRYLGAAPF
jgi:HK97 family phage prohead protease